MMIATKTKTSAFTITFLFSGLVTFTGAVQLEGGKGRKGPKAAGRKKTAREKQEEQARGTGGQGGKRGRQPQASTSRGASAPISVEMENTYEAEVIRQGEKEMENTYGAEVIRQGEKEIQSMEEYQETMTRARDDAIRACKMNERARESGEADDYEIIFTQDYYRSIQQNEKSLVELLKRVSNIEGWSRCSREDAGYVKMERRAERGSELLGNCERALKYINELVEGIKKKKTKAKLRELKDAHKFFAQKLHELMALHERNCDEILKLQLPDSSDDLRAKTFALRACSHLGQNKRPPQVNEDAATKDLVEAFKLGWNNLYQSAGLHPQVVINACEQMKTLPGLTNKARSRYLVMQAEGLHRSVDALDIAAIPCLEQAFDMHLSPDFDATSESVVIEDWFHTEAGNVGEELFNIPDASHQSKFRIQLLWVRANQAMDESDAAVGNLKGAFCSGNILEEMGHDSELRLRLLKNIKPQFVIRACDAMLEEDGIPDGLRDSASLFKARFQEDRLNEEQHADHRGGSSHPNRPAQPLASPSGENDRYAASDHATEAESSAGRSFGPLCAEHNTPSTADNTPANADRDFVLNQIFAIDSTMLNLWQKFDSALSSWCLPEDLRGTARIKIIVKLMLDKAKDRGADAGDNYEEGRSHLEKNVAHGYEQARLMESTKKFKESHTYVQKVIDSCNFTFNEVDDRRRNQSQISGHQSQGAARLFLRRRRRHRNSRGSILAWAKGNAGSC